MITVGTADAFVSRFRYLLGEVDKPIAFVVGSGLTRGTVAGVDRIVTAMRAALSSPQDQERFDIEVVGPSWGDRYQQAAQFLLVNRGQDLINRIIRAAVLRSCTSVSVAEAKVLSKSEPSLRQLEVDGAWSLDPGVQALGTLLTRMPADVRGPVITTNFDPHLEIAVRLAGGQPFTQWIDIDGKIATIEDSGAIETVHVHGLWRRGDTLHTVPQLTRPRPMLAGSLREALRGHTVIILGYSGWPDAFSRTLLAQAHEREYVGMDIIWCHYGPFTEADVERELFRELAEGNSTVVYEQVDSNIVLPEVLSAYSKDLAPAASAVSSIRGWTHIDASFLALRASKSDAKDTAQFIDGAEPTWRVAQDARVARLSFARELRSKFERTEAIIVAGIGSMGEGKSLAVRQAAVDLADNLEIDVLWREPGTPLRVSDILAYTPRGDGTLLLVSDDGDLLIDDLILLTRELMRLGRVKVRVLLVASERDWRNAGGFIRLGPNTAVVSAGALSLEDAQRVVGAWEAVDGVDLGQVGKLPKDSRAATLYDRATDPASQGVSLIGAMLQVRYGEHLIDRVDNLLGKLQRQNVTSGVSLEDAFLMICIMHSAFDARDSRSKPISIRVLSAATSLSTTAAQYIVIEPLGREAAVSQHGEELWARHFSIAVAAIEASRRRDPEVMRRALETLVQAAVNLAPSSGPLPADVYPVAYLSSSLRDNSDAVVAAEAAIEAEPLRITYRTSVVAAYRRSRLLDEALNAAERAWRSDAAWKDPESWPAFLSEWGTSAGLAGQPALNVLLDALALVSPHVDLVVGEGGALLGMGVGLRELHIQTKDQIYVDALRAVVYLVREKEMSRRDFAYMRNHEKYLRDQHVAPVTERAAALDHIQAAVDSLQVSPPQVLREYLAKHPVSVVRR